MHGHGKLTHLALVGGHWLGWLFVALSIGGLALVLQTLLGQVAASPRVRRWASHAGRQLTRFSTPRSCLGCGRS